MKQFIPANQPLPIQLTSASQPPTGAQAVINNLLVHVPTEAVTLSVALLPLTLNGNEVRSLEAWLLFIGLLVVMIVVRALQKATKAVWITTIIAFFLWMALVPKGALQQYDVVAAHTNAILIIAGVFSAIVTALGTFGKIK